MGKCGVDLPKGSVEGFVVHDRSVAVEDPLDSTGDPSVNACSSNVKVDGESLTEDENASSLSRPLEKVEPGKNANKNFKSRQRRRVKAQQSGSGECGEDLHAVVEVPKGIHNTHAVTEKEGENGRVQKLVRIFEGPVPPVAARVPVPE